MQAPIRDFLLRCSCAVGLLAGTGIAQAEIYVIVHRDSPVIEADAQSVANLYLGRTRSLAAGRFAVLFDQADNAARERFVRSLLGMSLPQINAYWARLSFTGRVAPPSVRAGDAEVIAGVRDNPAAVGYVASPPRDDSVRVILRLED